MNIRRLSDAGIRNLGLLFGPPGLPLVSKVDPGTPTTSILVRGGPGTGKTTTSLAMAHAIAQEHTGTVLFLTTEFSPAEVGVKAGLLGLPEESVVEWARRAETHPGSILVQHLSATKSTDPRDETSVSGDQKQRAMEAVWAMLQDATPPATGIRAVVIDAFGLPDAEEKAGKLRSDLVPFIQALEKRGVSTVLVEESITGGPDWLAFVTDVVFELSFQADADSGELHRKLVCKKSRYAQAIPGPHDFGLDFVESRPSVFPDPLLSLGAVLPGRESIPTERRAALFIPLTEDGDAVIAGRGALILNPYDLAGGKLMQAFYRTPGVRPVVWQCGPVSTLRIDNRHARLHESAGPYAICDAILGMLSRNQGNAVAINNIGALPSSARYRTGLPRALDALRRRGCVVLLHGLSNELAPFGPFADVEAEKQSRGSFHVAPRRYCPVTLHLPSADLLWSIVRPGPSDEMPAEEDGSIVQRILEAVRAAEKARAQGETTAALRWLEVEWFESHHVAWSPWVTTAYFVLSIVRRTLGIANDPRLTYLQARLPDMNLGPGATILELLEQFAGHTALHGPLAWTFAIMGNMHAATFWCLQSFEGIERAPKSNIALWVATQTIYARSAGALDTLIRLAATKAVASLFIGFALDALVAHNRGGELDDVVSNFLRENPIPKFMELRLRSEAFLHARDPALREKAREALMSLAENQDIPPLHQAEIFHNIGYVHERLGKSADARVWYQRAREKNPQLSLAAEALARFDRPHGLEAVPENANDAASSDAAAADSEGADIDD